MYARSHIPPLALEQGGWRGGGACVDGWVVGWGMEGGWGGGVEGNKIQSESCY